MRLQGIVDSFFHFAHGIQVLVELGLVVGTDSAAQGLGVVEHEVEHAGVVRLQRLQYLGSLGVVTGDHGNGARAKEAVESQLRHDLLGHRGVWVTPGNVRSQKAGETTAYVVDPSAWLVDSQLEGGEGGAVADRSGHDLVHGSASRIQSAASSALDVSSGQPGGYLRPMPIAANRLFVP